MSNKKYLFIFLILIFACLVQGQECDVKIEGQVIDEGTGLPLPYVYVIVQEKSDGTITNEEGRFLLEDLCVGHFHIIFSHIGCESKRFHVDLERDTIMNVLLPHTPTSLEGVTINGKKNNNQPSLSVSRQSIEDNNNKNLSGLLENETGVHLIKNGNSISKPIVHGLYGNRLTILNNGIAQSGQQWGNDHSPEIDPFSADKLTILKGANALQYGGGNLGSTVLIESTKIGLEPHLHGQVAYAYESNGRGHTINTRLQKYTPLFGWRVSGSLKKYGDAKSASYYLNNTGVKEANFSMQLEKSFKDKLFLELYASTFNTTLGVLRGSHIGNLSDLELAFDREIPFNTEPDFSYAIDPPKQKVSHHLTKLSAKYFVADDHWYELILATQINNRKEFDIRRNERSDIPALSLQQYAFNTELNFVKEFSESLTFKVGQQNVITDNTNIPETNIFPLIPDYISWKSGFFSTLSKQTKKLDYNLGIRYDYEFQDVVTFTQTLPREILRFENNFHNLGAIIGFNYKLTKSQTISFNTGFATRNPAVNELYSNGLHQGVSGIEEGDVDLNTERAIKNVVEYKWLPSANFSLSTLFYHQQINDYIFLNPQDEIRLTIRGSFPVFKYEQTDATIFGIDVSSQFTFSNTLYGTLKYSYIKGQDVKQDIPLVYMPPNSSFASLTYHVNNPLKKVFKLNLDELEIELNNRFVFRQNNLLESQDFVSAPPSYNLVGFKVSTNVIFPNYKIRVFSKIDNVLNVQYRDYLNRQRYFADDLGISIVGGINIKF